MATEAEIEKVARAMCSACGRDPDESVTFFVDDEFRGFRAFWREWQVKAIEHLAAYDAIMDVERERFVGAAKKMKEELAAIGQLLGRPVRQEH